MTVEWLTSWWNLIFILPFGLGLLYLGLYTLSGWTIGDADSDSTFDHDADIDADGSPDVEHDLTHDVDGEGEGHSASSHPSALFAILSWVGVGQMPLSLVVMIQMLCWGAIGFGAIQIQRGHAIGQSVAIAIAAAGLGSLWISHIASSILGPAVFKSANTSRRWHALLGARGEAIYPIDGTFGMVCGRDDRGDFFQAPCRVYEGHNPLAKGTAVQLVAYTAKDRMFYVVPADSALTPPADR